MTKSELIEILTKRQAHLKSDDVDLAVKSLLEMMGGALSEEIALKSVVSVVSLCTTVHRAVGVIQRPVNQLPYLENMCLTLSLAKNCVNVWQVLYL